MDTSIIEKLESAIGNHPSKLDCWGLLELDVHGDGGFYFEFFYAPLMAEDSIKSSVCVRVIGTDSPDKIADAVWGFFGTYKGIEPCLLSGHVGWRPWFSFELSAWNIANFATPGNKTLNHFARCLQLEARIDEQSVKLFNELVTLYMDHDDAAQDKLAELYEVMPTDIYNAIFTSDCNGIQIERSLYTALRDALILKATNPIIDLSNV